MKFWTVNSLNKDNIYQNVFINNLSNLIKLAAAD